MPTRPPKETYDEGHVKYGSPGWATQRRSDASIINARGSTWTQEKLDRIRAFYLAHEGKPMRLAELAKEMNTRRSTLSRIARWLGLAKRGRKHPYETRVRQAESMRKRLKEKGHPRGALGMKHSESAKKAMSARRKALGGLAMTHVQRHGMSEKHVMAMAKSKRATARPTNAYSRAKRGKRDDLGDIFWRSSWEANYARYLNLLVARGVIATWAFEADTFWFTGIKRGVMSYLPDFRVTRPDGSVHYVEVKGWMDAKSKTKIKRMAKYHPSVELEVVAAKQYREIERKLSGVIPNWE